MKIQKILKAFMIPSFVFVCFTCAAQTVTYKVAEVTVSQSRAFIIYSDGTKEEIPKINSQAQIIAKFLNEGWELRNIYYISSAPTIIFIKTEK